MFNRLIGRRLALVADTAGVTRDRNYAEADYAGRQFTLIDTGGFAEGSDELHARVEEQTRVAIDECDLVILVVDGRSGPTSTELELASRLRKGGKPVVLAVNKIDSEAQTAAAGDYYRLGFRDVYPISAEHGRGLTELLERMVELLTPPSTPVELTNQIGAIRMAIVGRPNVGKSTLVLSLIHI